MARIIHNRRNAWLLVALFLVLLAAGWVAGRLLPRDSAGQYQRIGRWLATP